ncbi:GNAT family N-acetyltransferase [Bacillaceae bacterium W0354]
MIRFYQKGDEASLNALFYDVFNKKRSEAAFAWKFINHPNENNPWILVYEEDGRILGSIALWVKDAFIHGEKKLIALRCDTMVHPDARGKGVYGALNEKMIEEAEKQGITYLYGFPSKMAKDRLIKKTGGKHLEDISRFTMIFRPFNILSKQIPVTKIMKPLDEWRTKRKLNRVQKVLDHEKYKTEPLEKFDSSVNELVEKTKDMRPVMIRRTEKYLNWRYFEHPDKTYKVFAIREDEHLLGYIVINQEESKNKVGSIIDALAIDDDDIWQILVRRAVVELGQCDFIQSWAIPGTQLAKILQQVGFFEKDKPMPLVGNLIDQAFEDIHDYKAFYITQGDVDSF